MLTGPIPLFWLYACALPSPEAPSFFEGPALITDVDDGLRRRSGRAADRGHHRGLDVRRHDRHEPRRRAF
ncbi:MAG: hypothetical protein IPN01_30860 [Deltaproteobacteria bacterium]|nr:hypothetical protein [Deltaproteobacteria bacterium]